MNLQDIQQRVILIVAEQSGIEAGQIKIESNLVSDLGMDSLDIIETVMAVEDEFAIEITDEETERMATVGDIATYLIQKGGA